MDSRRRCSSRKASSASLAAKDKNGAILQGIVTDG